MRYTMSPKHTGLHTPEVLVIFITGKCNARCSHCFYADHLNRTDDALNLGIIRRIIGSLSRPTAISLTGGEPFTRDDLANILDVILASDLVKSISIMSNGFRPQRVKSILSQALAGCKKPIHLQLSLDGMEVTHDKIRGFPGGFNRIISTAQWLYQAMHVWQHLSYMISITVMRDNIAEVPTLVAALRKQGLNSKITFVRGNSFSTFGVPREILNCEYESGKLPADVDQLDELVSHFDKCYPDYFSDTSRCKLQAALYTLRYKARLIPCLAGFRDGVIYHDGHVGICEQIISFGHLSDWDWDLHAAWNSDDAASHRKKMRSCACIHGCNLTTAANLVLRQKEIHR